MTTLRAGIIGLGVGEKHAAAFDTHPYCEVAALCDIAEDRLSDVGADYPRAGRTQSWQEIISDPSIDIVSVASYDDVHAEQVIGALSSGKHVFAEKPLCLHPAEARGIRQALTSSKGLRLSSNLNLRTCPRFMAVRDNIRSGNMGEVFHAEADYLWGRRWKLTDGWRKDMPFYSIIHGAAVHMVDLIMWLTDSRPTEVQGYGNRIATARSEFRFNDFAAVLLQFENGMTAKVAASGACVHPHFHRVTVFGTQQTFLHDMEGAKIVSSSASEEPPTPVEENYPGVDRKANVITSFIDSILDAAVQPVVSTEDVFATMAVCFAAEAAITRGKPVRIDYL